MLGARIDGTSQCEEYDLLRKGSLDAAIDVLDKHIARTKTTYASSFDDIAAADKAASERVQTSGRRVAVRRL
jgi:hypothetical protein